MNYVWSRRPWEARLRSLRLCPATRGRRSGLRARRTHQPTATSSHGRQMLGLALAQPSGANLVDPGVQSPAAGQTGGAVAPMGVAAALIPITPLWASVPSGTGSRGHESLSWKRALVLTMRAGPLGGGQSSASLDDGRSVVTDRLLTPLLSFRSGTGLGGARVSESDQRRHRARRGPRCRDRSKGRKSCRSAAA